MFIYDFVHVLKNLHNNWITEPSKELSLNVDGNDYVAKWAGILKLYEEDKQTPIRLTKLTYISVHPKPLQRRSVPLVWQVFHEKTYAALEPLEPNFHFSKGTMIFIKIICKWYKMMNVKSKFSRTILVYLGQKIAAIFMPCKRHVTLFLCVDGKVVKGEGIN